MIPAMGASDRTWHSRNSATIGHPEHRMPSAPQYSANVLAQQSYRATMCRVENSVFLLLYSHWLQLIALPSSRRVSAHTPVTYMHTVVPPAVSFAAACCSPRSNHSWTQCDFWHAVVLGNYHSPKTLWKMTTRVFHRTQFSHILGSPVKKSLSMTSPKKWRGRSQVTIRSNSANNKRNLTV